MDGKLLSLHLMAIAVQNGVPMEEVALTFESPEAALDMFRQSNQIEDQ